MSRAVNRALLAVVAASSFAHADTPAPAPVAPAPVNTEKGTSTVPFTKEEDEAPKLSLATEADRVAWTRPGFRLSLGLVYGDVIGLRGTPSGRLIAAQLHAGLRLDRDWSMLATFEYGQVSKHLGLSGLRFAGTIDPTWHVTPSLALAVGFGFGGFVEGSTGRPDVMPYGSTLDSSYTFGSSNPPMPQCVGVGAAALARGTYSYILGPRGAFDVELEVLGQYTACVNPTRNINPDNAQPIVREQYWPHTGVTLSAGFMWR